MNMVGEIVAYVQAYKAKGHDSHSYSHDLSTLRPSFEADFFYFKFCFKEKNDEKNCFDVGNSDWYFGICR